MQVIKNLKIDDVRKNNYIKIKGYKACYKNHFYISEDFKDCYTGIIYEKELGLRQVKIRGWINSYELVCTEFGRYDINPILGMHTGYLFNTNLDEVLNIASLFLQSKCDIGTNGINLERQ